MRMRIRENLSVYTFFLGMCTVIIGYFAWCLSTVSYRGLFYKGAFFLCTIVTMGLYIGTVILSKTDDKMQDEAIARQLMNISLIGSMLVGILLIVDGNDLIGQREYVGFIIEILWLLVFLCSYILLRKKCCGVEKIIVIGAWWRKHKWLCCLMGVTICMLYDPDAIQFKWDGLLYFRTCNELNIGSISSLAIYGHIAQTYGMLNGIASRIIDDTAAVMIFIHCCMTIISICAFYGLMKLMIEDRKEWVYVSTTAVYAFSPFLLGMVHYHNLDYLCQCFFPVVLYFLYKKEWVYFGVVSLLFCFTKEPALIAYSFMCFGVVLSEWFGNNRDTFEIRFKRLFVQKRYYLMALPGGLWLMTYSMLGPWSAGEGGFSLDWAYIIEKLKVLYVFNFNWVFSIVVIAGLICFICYRRWNRLILVLPIFCSHIAFICFSCLFKTVNHPRYVDVNQVALYALAMIILFEYRANVQHIFSCIMAGILLLASFCTIDPVTISCFPTYNIGTAHMVTTMENGVPLGDGMIYNRQMLGLERIINMALADILADSEIVLFPAIEDNAYFFDGMAEVGAITDEYYVEQEYWDTEKQKRVPFMMQGTKSFQAYQLTDKMNWNNLEKEICGRVSYLYLPFIGEQHAAEIEKRYHILEEKDYQYRGWELKKICFEMN